MEFGISFLPDAEPDTQSPVDYYAAALDLCRIADLAGLSAIKMTEHYLKGYGGYCPSPLQFLSAAAAVTRDIRLMTGGIMANFHHPLQIAAETAMLDAISGGRAEIGFARAYLPYEFDAFGVDMDGSHERFRSTVDTVLRLWQELDVTARGPHFAFTGATSLPRPTQQPHPPVWVAAVQSGSSLRWIGANGFNLLVTPGLQDLSARNRFVAEYRSGYTARDAANSGARVALSLPITVRDTSQQAIESSDRHLRHYLTVWGDSANAWNTASSTDYPNYTGFGAALAADSPERMRSRGAALAGSPDQVADQIGSLASTVDLDMVLLQLEFGAASGEDSRRTLELFVDKVLPQCR